MIGHQWLVLVSGSGQVIEFDLEVVGNEFSEKILGIGGCGGEWGVVGDVFSRV